MFSELVSLIFNLQLTGQASKNCFEMFTEDTDSEREDTLKKLVRNSECSKFDYFKELSALVSFIETHVDR